jgi:hypothetical protein
MNSVWHRLRQNELFQTTVFSDESKRFQELVMKFWSCAKMIGGTGLQDMDRRPMSPGHSLESYIIFIENHKS